MIYLNTETNEYPRHDGDLELLGWSVGEPLPENWVVVEYTEPPEIDEETTYWEVPPTLVNGVWKITYATRALTEKELLWRQYPRPNDGKTYIWNESKLKWE